MRRAANAHGRRDEGVETIGEQAGEVVAEQRVGGERQVQPVLLGRPERDHHGVAPGRDLVAYLGPGQLVQLDDAHAAKRTGPAVLVSSVQRTSVRRRLARAARPIGTGSQIATAR